MPFKGYSSGIVCCVKDCSNSNRRLYFWKHSKCDVHLGLLKQDCPCLTPYGFHRFPKDSKARLQWISNINRKDFTPGKYTSVCSIHFPDGRPSKINPNPVLTLGYETRKVTLGRRLLVRDFSQKLKKVKEKEPAQNQEDCTQTDWNDSTRVLSEPLAAPSGNETSVTCEAHGFMEVDQSELCSCRVTKKATMIDKSTQWDPYSISMDHSYCKPLVNGERLQQINKPKLENSGTQVNMPNFPKLMTDNDCVFYTGLPLKVFLCLVTTLCTAVTSTFTKLNPDDQILLVMCRIRLGLLFGDLARRFSVSTSLASRIFNFWISVMAKELKGLICWLPREVIRSTMPECFKVHYPYTTCVIDCTEIIMERARSHWVRAVTYSNYKSRNTVKFLVAIAPSGFVMFVSDCFGGRTSDKFLTEHSGFLDYLLPGDQVMADRGFTVDDILPPLVKLNVPPFTKGLNQLPEVDVTKGRRVASVRVHVERVIARIKNFRFLKSCFPLSQSDKVDKIVLVCAALCNLQQRLIK